MTVSQLFALYRAAHAEARRLSDGGVASACELQVVDGEGLTRLERVIVELALHDLTDGRPVRTWREFERAVEQGTDLLRALGLRPGPDAAEPPEPAEAAWRLRLRGAPQRLVELR